MVAAAVHDARFWSAIIADRPLAANESAAFRPAILRLAQFTSPALVDWLLKSPGDGSGPLFSSAEIERSRLLARFTRAQGLRWLGVIAESGIEVVCMKGVASGVLLYPDADLRPLSDIDLLVRRRDLKRLVEVLAAKGFVFHEAMGTPRWGHIGDASFHPFVAPAGSFSFDLHIQPDDFPTHHGLSADDVFAAAQTVAVDGISVRIPCGSHFLLLALTNAARDKLGPDAMKSIIDTVVYLGRSDLDPDWAEILKRARRGGFLKTMQALVAVLATLGVPERRLPYGLGTLFAGELNRTVADLADCYPVVPGKWALQRREILLLAPLPVIARRYMRRLRGLIVPWSGMPSF
jgi:hypothetical protein